MARNRTTEQAEQAATATATATATEPTEEGTMTATATEQAEQAAQAEQEGTTTEQGTATEQAAQAEQEGTATEQAKITQADLESTFRQVLARIVEQADPSTGTLPDGAVAEITAAYAPLHARTRSKLGPELAIMMFIAMSEGRMSHAQALGAVSQALVNVTVAAAEPAVDPVQVTRDTLASLLLAADVTAFTAPEGTDPDMITKEARDLLSPEMIMSVVKIIRADADTDTTEMIKALGPIESVALRILRGQATKSARRASGAGTGTATRVASGLPRREDLGVIIEEVLDRHPGEIMSVAQIVRDADALGHGVISQGAVSNRLRRKDDAGNDVIAPWAAEKGLVVRFGPLTVQKG